MSPLPGSPAGPLRKDARHQSFLLHNLQGPSKGAPPSSFPSQRAHREREMPRLQSPLSTISQSSWWTDYPMALYREWHPSPELSSAYFLVIHLSLKVPINETPSMTFVVLPLLTACWCSCQPERISLHLITMTAQYQYNITVPKTPNFMQQFLHIILRK